MRTFRKHIDCGIYSFDVVVDRDIAVKVMEEFPNLCDYVFTTARDSANKYAKARSQGKQIKAPDELDVMLENVRNKKMGEMLERDKELQESVKFAFPLMLERAGSDLDANEIINYIYENGVDGEFNSGIYELVLLGFTQREVHTKKVNFSMK